MFSIFDVPIDWILMINKDNNFFCTNSHRKMRPEDQIQYTITEKKDKRVTKAHVNAIFFRQLRELLRKLLIYLCLLHETNVDGERWRLTQFQNKSQTVRWPNHLNVASNKPFAWCLYLLPHRSAIRCEVFKWQFFIIKIYIMGVSLWINYCARLLWNQNYLRL